MATLTLDLRRPLTSLWNGVTKSRRKEIKRARNRGITFEKSTDHEEYENMLNHLRRGLNLNTRTVKPNPPYLFIARTKEGLAVAGNDFYTCEKGTRLRASTGGTYRLIPDLKAVSGLANAFLIWEQIKWAKEQGFITYDFGGYAESGIANGIDVSGVNYFKKSFGGKIVPKTC